MKKTALLKIATVALMSSGFLAGCASDATEDPAPATEAAQECPSAAAKNAIYSAKVKLAKAEKLGYAWRDTGKMIADAEKAAAGCDNDKAIALANQAAEQAEDAVAQYNAEKERYEAERAKAAMMDSSASSDSATYTVESGDNLWSISGQAAVYGNPYQWPLIYKANAAKIQDADLIFPGQEFDIPTASAAEIDAAVNHAKTRGAWSIGEAEKSDMDYVLGFK